MRDFYSEGYERYGGQRRPGVGRSPFREWDEGDRWSKREAEDIVNLARGVKDTHNHLRVARAEQPRGNGRAGHDDVPSPGREQRHGQATARR